MLSDAADDDDAFNNYLATWISELLLSHDHTCTSPLIPPSQHALTVCSLPCRCICLCLLLHLHHHLLLLLRCCSPSHPSVHPFVAFICHYIHSLVKKCINLALSLSLSLFCYKSWMNKSVASRAPSLVSICVSGTNISSFSCSILATICPQSSHRCCFNSHSMN